MFPIELKLASKYRHNSLFFNQSFTYHMRSSQNRYNLRGVSSSKEEVHQVVDRLDRGLFQEHFVRLPLIY